MARINLRLKPGRDDDLIAWWNSIPEGDRSYFLRETLRRGLGSQAGGFQAPPIAAAGPVAPRAPMTGSGKTVKKPAPVPVDGGEESLEDLEKEMDEALKDLEEVPLEDLEAALANLTNSF